MFVASEGQIFQTPTTTVCQPPPLPVKIIILNNTIPITVTVPSRTLGSGSLDSEIMGSNPAQGMEVCLRLSVLCCHVEVQAIRPYSYDRYPVHEAPHMSN
jgi:hypothetical protein